MEALSISNPMLAQRLCEEIVDRFLAGTSLSLRHRDEALAQTTINVGFGSGGQPNRLAVTLPLGSCNAEFEWDGSESLALAIADNAADRGIEDVRWDQENVGPTGWERSDDEADEG